MRLLNPARIKTQQVTVTTAGTPVQPSSYPIPEGIEFVVKAKSTNTGLVSIGGSSADALQTGSACFKLVASQGVSMQITDPANIWIDAAVSGEGVDIISEF